MAALFWLAFSLSALWGYIRVGKTVATAAARRTYRRAHADHLERWPSLGDRDARRSAQDCAQETYWVGRFLWPLSLVYLAATSRDRDRLDFSPDGQVLQERIKELERELGMRR